MAAIRQILQHRHLDANAAFESRREVLSELYAEERDKA